MPLNTIPPPTPPSSSSSSIQNNNLGSGSLDFSSDLSGNITLTTNGNVGLGATTATAGNYIVSNVQTIERTFFLWGETLVIEHNSWAIYQNNDKMMIAQLECLGTQCWESLRKNGIKEDLDEDLYKEIERIYKIKKRGENIDNVLSK